MLDVQKTNSWQVKGVFAVPRFAMNFVPIDSFKLDYHTISGVFIDALLQPFWVYTWKGHSSPTLTVKLGPTSPTSSLSA